MPPVIQALNNLKYVFNFPVFFLELENVLLQFLHLNRLVFENDLDHFMISFELHFGHEFRSFFYHVANISR